MQSVYTLLRRNEPFLTGCVYAELSIGPLFPIRGERLFVEKLPEINGESGEIPHMGNNGIFVAYDANACYSAVWLVYLMFGTSVASLKDDN